MVACSFISKVGKELISGEELEWQDSELRGCFYRGQEKLLTMKSAAREQVDSVQGLQSLLSAALPK